jgi:hypothetical protein
MKASPIIIVFASALVLVALVGCQGAPQPSVDTAATVSAAVQATTLAQANLAATVDAAVKATAAAQPTTASQATPTLAAAAQKSATPKPPTPSPTPSVNYVTMTEEELAAVIDQAVKEAVAATTASTTTTTYSADGTLTAQEVQAMQTAVTAAQTEISQALALMQAYYDLYAQIATDTLTTLQAIEQDLNSLATSMNAMATSLAQISTTLSQGLTLAQSTITQLQSYATKASQTAANVQAKEKTWAQTVQKELDQRATAALNVKPTNVPTDFRSTTQSVSTYLDTVRAALADSKVTQKELSAISLAGANATAGLKQFGGAEGQNLANSINTMTRQLARGETTKAKNSFAGLEQSARSLPSVPSSPGGGIQPPRK